MSLWVDLDRCSPMQKNTEEIVSLGLEQELSDVLTFLTHSPLLTSYLAVWFSKLEGWAGVLVCPVPDLIKYYSLKVL